MNKNEAEEKAAAALKFIDKNFDELNKNGDPVIDAYIALQRAYEKYEFDADLTIPIEQCFGKLVSQTMEKKPLRN